MAKILLIEDDPLIVNIYGNFLGNKKHTVKSVEEGTNALEAAKEFKPDLILLDLMVPKLGGASILEKLRGEAEFAKTPILIYTNLDSPGKKEELLDKGATAFVSKGQSNPKEVVRLIEDYLQN